MDALQMGALLKKVEKMSPGEIRKEIYAYLEKEGFEMTDERHQLMSFYLKMNANSLNREVLKKLTKEGSRSFQYEIRLGIRNKTGLLLKPNEVALPDPEAKVEEKVDDRQGKLFEDHV